MKPFFMLVTGWGCLYQTAQQLTQVLFKRVVCNEANISLSQKAISKISSG